jgi:predicted nucleic acid-binding protein
MIHLDTNCLINLHFSDSPLRKRLITQLKAGENLSCSVIAWAEYLCGPLTPNEIALSKQLISHPPVPLDENSATLGAQLFNRTGRKRQSLADCLIAATAIYHDATLITLNSRDFLAFEAFGLKIGRTESER